MKILTKEILSLLPKLYANEAVPLELVKVPLKIFDPQGSWTWYITEYSPAMGLAFGWVCGNVQEWGYVDIPELLQLMGCLGLHMERDKGWRTSSTYLDVCRAEGLCLPSAADEGMEKLGEQGEVYTSTLGGVS